MFEQFKCGYLSARVNPRLGTDEFNVGLLFYSQASHYAFEEGFTNGTSHSHMHRLGKALRYPCGELGLFQAGFLEAHYDVRIGINDGDTIRAGREFCTLVSNPDFLRGFRAAFQPLDMFLQGFSAANEEGLNHHAWCANG